MVDHQKLFIRVKVRKLVNSNFVKENMFHTSLVNYNLLRKPNCKWWVDFRDLNKICPKDLYPLSHIDQLVNVTYGFELLSFMDA